MTFRNKLNALPNRRVIISRCLMKINKMASKKNKIISVTNFPNFDKSTFTLTFAVELVGSNVWQDCTEESLELGPCTQGLKIQYQIYQGQSFELDVLLWPYVAKIWCDSQSGWVRTWQFLESRWIAFSIKHAFAVRVNDLREYNAQISVINGMTAFGPNAKNDKTSKVYLPLMKFGQRRYFAEVNEEEQSLTSFVEDLFWIPLLEFIPKAVLDGPFDKPHAVVDIRHQDALIFQVRELIVNRNTKLLEERSYVKVKGGQSTKSKAEVKSKLEIKISGESLLAGVGRVKCLETEGPGAADLGEVMVFISSSNLPAADDHPIFFVNIDDLFNAPVKELVKLCITHIYTRWRCCDEVHESNPIEVCSKLIEIKFNDHYPTPLTKEAGTKLLSKLNDEPFVIELCGIKEYKPNKTPKLFSKESLKDDPPKTKPEDTNILLAICRVDLKPLVAQRCGFVEVECPLQPLQLPTTPKVIKDLGFESKVVPAILLPTSVILEAQMSLKVSIGLVGCRLKIRPQYLRLYCTFNNNDDEEAIIEVIKKNNKTTSKDNEVIGWAIDDGTAVVMYFEGTYDSEIISIWKAICNLDKAKVIFSDTDFYSTLLYSELLEFEEPFLVLKLPNLVLENSELMRKMEPSIIQVIKSGLEKLRRLVEGRLETVPCDGEMLTVTELKCLWLELCDPRRKPHD